MKNKKLKKIKAEEYKEEESIEKVLEETEDEVVYDEDINDITEESDDDYNNVDETYVEDNEPPTTKSNKLMNIFNIIFIALIIIMILISIDVICVSKYNIGPFFAIKTKTYEDGGTKVYHGIGYKVIKYNEVQGRKDIQIGSWNLQYSNIPTEIEDIDLAIEFQNDYEKTANKYYNQYIQITSKVKEVNTEKNKLIVEYTDSDGKYTLQVSCKISEDETDLTIIKDQQPIKVRGIVDKFSIKDGKEPNKIYMTNCYVE